jgi:hypothetical protein
MRHLLPAAAFLVAALLAAGCSSAPRDGGPHDPDMLLEDEILASGGRTAYEVIQRLRPLWLRQGPPRSTRLDTVILVYYEGTRLGGLEALRELNVDQIRSIRVLDSATAGQLPGLGSQHVERVIMISYSRVH